MSQEEVKKAFPDKRFREEGEKKTIIYFEDKILGDAFDHTTTSFFFSKNQLWGVAIHFSQMYLPNYPQITFARIKFNELLGILKEKYGTPKRLNKGASDSGIIDEEMALASDSGIFYAEWETKESIITLKLTKLGNKNVSLELLYESIYLKNLNDAAVREKALKEKF